MSKRPWLGLDLYFFMDNKDIYSSAVVDLYTNAAVTELQYQWNCSLARWTLKVSVDYRDHGVVKSHSVFQVANFKQTISIGENKIHP